MVAVLQKEEGFNTVNSAVCSYYDGLAADNRSFDNI